MRRASRHARYVEGQAELKACCAAPAVRPASSGSSCREHVCCCLLPRARAPTREAPASSVLAPGMHDPCREARDTQAPASHRRSVPRLAGTHRPLRIWRQLEHEHRERVLRWPAIHAVVVARCWRQRLPARGVEADADVPRCVASSRSGHARLAGVRMSRAVLALLRVAALHNGRHRYLSTACLHEAHELCRRACKWCGEPCLCECHGGLPWATA